MSKEHIALHITIIVQQNFYNKFLLLIFGEIWSKVSNFTSLTLTEAFAKVPKVNTEALNIKSCQPRQKYCRGKAEAKCIFI